MNREKLLSQISSQQALAMFNLLPEISFWIKDKQSRVMYANDSYITRVGYKNLEQLIGKSDYDFSPKHIAKQFIVDDQKVMAGDVVTDRLEMNLTKEGGLAWYLTSKKPLSDNDGNIIGSFGVTRHLHKTSEILSGITEIKAPVDYVRNNYQEEISVEKLADIAFLSISALERRFKKYLSKTPKQFIREFRLEKARQLLVETRLPIAEIAYECGFSDHSYFSRHFKMMFHELPSQLRTDK